MHKFAVNMHIMGHGDCMAIVEGHTVPEVHKKVHAIADANDVSVVITEIISWKNFIIQEDGFDLIPPRN